MSTRTINTITKLKGSIDMETIFYTLHDFMLHSKSITYVLIGGILIGLMLFWFFLTGRDEKKRTF
jgi:hypothetical protein